MFRRSILHRTLITLCVVATAALPSCATWPGLDNPTLTVSPEYTAFRMTGTTRMESGSPPTKGDNLSVADLGASDREDNLGVMLSYGIQPGPRMLEAEPAVFWGVIVSMYIGNLVLLALNLPLIPYISKVIYLSRRILIPCVIAFSLR